jgi:hypothetical protein
MILSVLPKRRAANMFFTKNALLNGWRTMIIALFVE